MATPPTIPAPPSDIQIRPAFWETDLDPLADLFDAYRTWYKQVPDRQAAYNYLEARLRSNEATVFVAESTDASGAKQLVGFALFYPLFSSIQMKRLYQLNDLFVDSEYRGKGISKLLIARAKQLVLDTGAAGFQLETQKSNVIGNSLYKASGMNMMSEDHNYYEWQVRDQVKPEV